MVFVAGKHIDNISKFSSSFLSILKLIADGSEWLKWALTDPSLSVYYARDEKDLLTKIQMGLHENLLLRNDLFVLHLDFVMALEEADLNTLVTSFSSGQQTNKEVISLIKKYGLITNEELQSVDTFIKKHGLSTFPAFQNLAFSEKMELYHFQQSLQESQVLSEAIDFANKKSATLSEFVCYTAFYQNCVEHQLTSDDNVRRQQAVEEIYDQLSAHCFSLIYVPNIGSFDSLQDLADHLKDFLITTKFIGYRIKAAAMANLIKNIKVKGLSGDKITMGIDQYLLTIRQHVLNGKFVSDPISQDGWLKTFTCVSNDFRVVIQVNVSGDVYLSPDSQPLKAKT